MGEPSRSAWPMRERSPVKLSKGNGIVNAKALPPIEHPAVTRLRRARLGSLLGQVSVSLSACPCPPPWAHARLRLLRIRDRLRMPCISPVGVQF
jgi:hypothetical protein